MLYIEVHLFIVLREKIGRSQLSISLPPGATAADLLDVLFKEYPEVAGYRPVARIAINYAYASLDERLQEDDEVALITPVSGG